MYAEMLITLVLLVCFIFHIRNKRATERAEAEENREKEIRPIRLDSIAMLQVVYKTEWNNLKVVKDRDFTKLSSKQLYLLKSFFKQYYDVRNVKSQGTVTLLATNHVGETVSIKVDTLEELANVLNKIFVLEKSLSTYRRMYSKGE